MTNPPTKILLVEDNAGDARLIQEWLEETMGADVSLLRATRVSEGLEHMSADPDVVLLDMNLPDSRGLETFTTMHARNTSVPIIIMSGLADGEIALEAIREGAQDYLIKGKFNSSALGRVIRYGMERKQLERMKDRFISTVSHEMRTPLSITKEGISLLLDKIPGPINEKQTKVLVTVRENINRLTRIINNVLDSTAIASGKLPMHREELNVVDVIRIVTASFDARARAKGLTLKMDVPPEGVRAYADPDRLTQIFTNLVGNAMKFTDAGAITISARDRGGKVECAVEDSGRGIAPEDLSHVFSRFRQFGKPAGAGEQGTGLGLTITKGLVELHHGQIHVESKAGQGARFVFTLPKPESGSVSKEESGG